MAREFNESSLSAGEDCVDTQVSREVAPIDRSRPKKVTIKSLDRGFLVKVGCQLIAVGSTDELVRGLTEYFRDPEGVETTWERTAKLPFEPDYVPYPRKKFHSKRTGQPVEAENPRSGLPEPLGKILSRGAGFTDRESDGEGSYRG